MEAGILLGPGTMGQSSPVVKAATGRVLVYILVEGGALAVAVYQAFEK